MISIIIASYNYERYVTRAVESALAQTLPCEVIVVDDGSTDGSPGLLAGFGDRIILLHRENGGEAAARYTGLQRATGDTVIFLDADDVLYPHCAATVVEHMGGGISKVQWRLDLTDADSNSLNMPLPPYPSGLTPEDVFRMRTTAGRYPTPPCSGNAYAREFLDKILPVDVRFRKTSDGYANHLAPLYGNIVTVPEILGAYRRHGANAWARENAEDMWGIYTRHELERQDAFVEHARRLGIDVAVDGILRDTAHLESRMLSLRLKPELHPVAEDKRWPLLIRSLRGVAGAYYLSVVGRFMWATYLTLIAAMPVPLLRRVLPGLRGAGRRSPVAKLLVAFSRVRLPRLADFRSHVLRPGGQA